MERKKTFAIAALFGFGILGILPSPKAVRSQYYFIPAKLVLTPWDCSGCTASCRGTSELASADNRC